MKDFEIDDVDILITDQGLPVLLMPTLLPFNKEISVVCHDSSFDIYVGGAKIKTIQNVAQEFLAALTVFEDNNIGIVEYTDRNSVPDEITNTAIVLAKAPQKQMKMPEGENGLFTTG